MSLPIALFAIVATITAVSALGVLLSRDIVRMAVWLLFTLIGVSPLTYFLLSVAGVRLRKVRLLTHCLCWGNARSRCVWRDAHRS